MTEEIKLVQCTKEQITTFAEEGAENFFPNSLCFENMDSIRLRKNWKYKEFETIVISIETCN